MHRAARFRIAVAVIAASTAISCAENSSPTAPDASRVDARVSHVGEQHGKKPKVASCKPQKEDRHSARIGSRGGSLTVGTNRLVIPAGALSREIEITAHLIPSNSIRLQFSPEGLQFAKPAILTMSYSQCDTPFFGVTVVYLQADSITEVEPSRVHPVQRTVTAEIRHFSSYAVAY